jgi:hypothetical protein
LWAQTKRTTKVREKAPRATIRLQRRLLGASRTIDNVAMATKTLGRRLERYTKSTYLLLILSGLSKVAVAG